MCKCEYCGLEMLTAAGCKHTDIKIGGKWMVRIKVGDPGDMMDVEPGKRCHDCGALYGHPHHPGCDSETCPSCGRQMITCGCDITEVRYTE